MTRVTFTTDSLAAALREVLRQTEQTGLGDEHAAAIIQAAKTGKDNMPDNRTTLVETEDGYIVEERREGDYSRLWGTVVPMSAMWRAVDNDGNEVGPLFDSMAEAVDALLAPVR